MRGPKSAFENGFALVEVLVGLAILSITLIAAMRAVALSADTQLALSQRTMAIWSADNTLNLMRIRKVWPDIGTTTFSCPQASFAFLCQRTVSSLPNPLFRKVEVTVSLAGQTNGSDRSSPRLAWLVTVVPDTHSGAL